MTVFLNLLGSKVGKAISKPFICPKGNEDSWSIIIIKEYNANSNAHYALLQSLNDDNISRVINCICVHNIWQVLLTHFTTVTNALNSLSKPNDNDQKVRKIIRALPQT